MKILYDPDPRTTEDIFSTTDRERFFSENEVAVYDGGDRESFYAAHLPLAEVLVSQQPMDRALLDSAPHLRAIFNVETNFLPNIDYPVCLSRGIHVLAPSSVFAEPVAEIGLGLALSLARDIHSAHNAFLNGVNSFFINPFSLSTPNLNSCHNAKSTMNQIQIFVVDFSGKISTKIIFLPFLSRQSFPAISFPL